MTTAEQPASPAEAEAAQLEAQMDSELHELRQHSTGPVRSHLNPVYQYEQRVGTAHDEGDATEVAARVTGELGAEADQERLKIEGMTQAVEQTSPGTDRATQAASAKARAEHDADDAIAASLDADVAAEDALHAEGSRHLHHSADPDAAAADKARALADESRAGRDLSDLDAVEQQVSDHPA
jgi:hypothetical protein